MLRCSRDDCRQALSWSELGHLVDWHHPVRHDMWLPAFRGSEHEQAIQEDIELRLSYSGRDQQTMQRSHQEDPQHGPSEEIHGEGDSHARMVPAGEAERDGGHRCRQGQDTRARGVPLEDPGLLRHVRRQPQLRLEPDGDLHPEQQAQPDHVNVLPAAQEEAA